MIRSVPKTDDSENGGNEPDFRIGEVAGAWIYPLEDSLGENES